MEPTNANKIFSAARHNACGLRVVFFLLIMCLAVPTSVGAASPLDTSGMVASDGDTLKLRDGSKVRLKYIDAPEKKQKFGPEAKEYLQDMVGGGLPVTLEISGRDKYKRYLGEVFLVGRSINLQLVKDGYAWAYMTKKPEYIEAEETARQERRGLWAQDSPVRPSDYRKKKPSLIRYLIVKPAGGANIIVSPDLGAWYHNGNKEKEARRSQGQKK